MTEIKIFPLHDEIEMIKTFKEGHCTIDDMPQFAYEHADEIHSLFTSIADIVTAPSFDQNFRIPIFADYHYKKQRIEEWVKQVENGEELT